MVALAKTTNISELENVVSNWDSVPDKVKNHLLKGVEFSITIGEENLFVYEERALHAKCTIVENKEGKVRIVDCWVLGGKNIW